MKQMEEQDMSNQTEHELFYYRIFNRKKYKEKLDQSEFFQGLLSSFLLWTLNLLGQIRKITWEILHFHVVIYLLLMLL